jgi:HEAT repeat protein
MLDQAIKALSSYDWGGDLAAIKPIEDAVVSTHGNADARKELEAKLAGVLTSDASRAAKDYVCRQLRIVGTVASVPAIAGLLADKDLSHMARYALESNPAPEAAAALRDSLARLEGPLKVGVLSSLGDRGDSESVKAIAVLLDSTDVNVAAAAANALGDIRTAEASQALASCRTTNPVVTAAITDASLCCAEHLLAAGNKAAALSIYKKYSSTEQKHVQIAAKRGMLSALGK